MASFEGSFEPAIDPTKSIDGYLAVREFLAEARIAANARDLGEQNAAPEWLAVLEAEAARIARTANQIMPQFDD